MDMPDGAATGLVYRFGRCEIDLRSRQLLRDGLVQHLEPLAFDLLAYLLRHRGRAVTKDELLDEVWLGRIVTVGALARAILTVRRAIGDGDPEQMVFTLHRVGYRFSGDVTVIDRMAPAVVEAAPCTVALLPFEDGTGDPTQPWLSVGLAALVGQALAFDPGLAPLSIRDVKKLLRSLPHDADFDRRAAVLQAQGVDHVVHVWISRGESGFRLDYRCRSRDGQTVGSVHAGEPVRLGRALARRLMTHLLPGTWHEIDGFQLHDPWAMLVFARAMQAIEDGELEAASHMLRVVLDIEPDYDEARCESERLDAMLGNGLAAH